MSALRFVAGVGAGAVIAALVAAASAGAPAAGTDVTATPPRVEEKPAAPASPPATALAKKGSVQRGVLARAAASRRAKGAGTAGGTANAQAPNGGKEAKGTKDVVESVEVDWGASQPRP